IERRCQLWPELFGENDAQAAVEVRRRLTCWEMHGVKVGSLCTPGAGAMNYAPDAFIGAATANIPRHEVGDLLVCRMRSLLKQSCRCHDLATLAITALRYIFRNPRFLQRM